MHHQWVDHKYKIKLYEQQSVLFQVPPFRVLSVACAVYLVLCIGKLNLETVTIYITNEGQDLPGLWL